MKIAITTDSFVEGQGGVATAIAVLARTLRHRGHKVMIYTAADPSHEKIDLDVVGLKALHYERFPGGRAPLAPIALTQELVYFAPDIIHNHSMSTMGIQALAVSKLLGIPVVGTCHIFLAGFLKYAPISLEGVPFTEEVAWKYTTAFFNRFPHVTTPSEVMRRTLILNGLKVPASAVSNGVDIELFSPNKTKNNQTGLPLNLLHVGRLSYEKRVDIVISAFQRLIIIHPQARLVIVGEGPEKTNLDTLTETMGISNSVDFMDFVPHEQLPSIYNGADIFVTASPIETQGLVALEAMACGLPVIGVDAMALPDLVKHERNGLLVPPDNEAAFAEAIGSLADKPVLRQAMGRTSRELALLHSMSEIASNYESIYRPLLQVPPRRLLPQIQIEITPSKTWEAFNSVVMALIDAGAVQAYEIIASIQEWSWKVFTPLTKRMRNGFRLQSSDNQPDPKKDDLSN